jgi:GntR family transcriptional regulator
MIESIDIHSSIAVYRQIENYFQFAIVSGRLKSDERLPTVREISEHLKVNTNTVAKAYRNLEVMGLVYTRRGMGVFVSNDAGKMCGEACRRRIIQRMHEVISEANAAGMLRKEVLAVVNASLAADSSPYGEVPTEVVGAVGGRNGKKVGK